MWALFCSLQLLLSCCHAVKGVHAWANAHLFAAQLPDGIERASPTQTVLCLAEGSYRRVVPIRDSIRSLFGLHNETGNIYTHLLGAQGGGHNTARLYVGTLTVDR